MKPIGNAAAYTRAAPRKPSGESIFKGVVACFSDASNVLSNIIRKKFISESREAFVIVNAKSSKSEIYIPSLKPC